MTIGSPALFSTTHPLTGGNSYGIKDNRYSPSWEKDLADTEKRIEELERKVRFLERTLHSMEENERLERRKVAASRRTNTFFRILIYALFFAALIIMMVWARGKLFL